MVKSQGLIGSHVHFHLALDAYGGRDYSFSSASVALLCLVFLFPFQLYNYFFHHTFQS